jgi:hypothetical protein
LLFAFVIDFLLTHGFRGSYQCGSERGIEGPAAAIGQGASYDVLERGAAYPSRLFDVMLCGGRHAAITGQTLLGGPEVDFDFVLMLPTLPVPEEIICVGAVTTTDPPIAATSFPVRPTAFVRFASKLISHSRCAKDSAARVEQLDVEVNSWLL